MALILDDVKILDPKPSFKCACNTYFHYICSYNKYNIFIYNFVLCIKDKPAIIILNSEKTDEFYKLHDIIAAPAFYFSEAHLKSLTDSSGYGRRYSYKTAHQMLNRIIDKRHAYICKRSGIKNAAAIAIAHYDNRILELAIALSLKH